MRSGSGERSGERDSQKSVLAASVNSAAPAPLTCSGRVSSTVMNVE